MFAVNHSKCVLFCESPTNQIVNTDNNRVPQELHGDVCVCVCACVHTMFVTNSH